MKEERVKAQLCVCEALMRACEVLCKYFHGFQQSLKQVPLLRPTNLRAEKLIIDSQTST